MKNIKKRVQLIALLLLFCFVAKGQQQQEAQSIVPPSPTVGSLIQYADCPVSYYSGTPNIHIPLYEINVDNIKIPISLSYHASGIKVAQEASWVGLGWSLNAGGCVSRSVQCYDDFLEYSYPGVGVTKGYYDDSDITSPTSSEYYSYIYTAEGMRMQLIKDSEPDIFYFSFLGYSGKFILDKSRGAVLFDKSANLKITVTETPYREKAFTITTPDGTKCIFNNREKAYFYSKNGSLHNNKSNATKWDDTEIAFIGSPVEYASSWMLSQIITPNKKEILFSYKSELYKAPVQESCIKYNFLNYYGNYTACGKNTSIPYYSTSKAVYETYRLSKISWDNGSVVFDSSEREDVKQTTYSPEKLKSIKIYNQAGTLLNGYNFEYNYFNANKTGSYDYVFKRLQLNNVTSINDSNNKYTFNYFSGTLPAKNSRNTDYWGYYNGRSYGENYYAVTVSGSEIYAGAAKESNLSYLKMGTLQSIQYPTGGVEAFTYEENTFYGGIASGGGVQTNFYKFEVYNSDKVNNYPDAPADTSFTFTLSRTTDVYIAGYLEANDYSRDNNYNYENDIINIYSVDTSKRRFSQTAAGLYGKDYLEVDRKVTLEAGTYTCNFLLPPADTYGYWTLKYDELTSSSPYSTEKKGAGLRIAQIDGGGKKRIFNYLLGVMLVDPVTSFFTTITCGNNGGIKGRFDYLAQTSESIVPLSSFRNGNYVGYTVVKETIMAGREESTTIYYFHNRAEEVIDDHPYMISYINFKNGLLHYIQYWKGKTLLKEENFEYEDSSSQLIKAFKFVLADMSSHSYDYRVEWSNRSVHTTVYEKNDPKYQFVNEEKYEYSEQMLPKLKKSQPYDKQLEERIYYPTDFTEPVFQKMVNANQIKKPVEQISLVDGQVISGYKFSYKDTLNMYLPAIKYELNIKSPLPEASYKSAYKAQVYYDLYNKNGKLLQKRENGVSTVYLWSYNGEYLVAEISNATYTTVASYLSAQGTTADVLCAKNTLSADDLRILNALRTTLPQSLITTYTYIPLVGVESITSPDGQTTYYEYDTNGRLQECFYKEGDERRVLKHYDYHYTNNHK